MGTIRNIRPPEAERAELLAAIPDGQLVCMSMHRHKFPSDELSPKMTRLPNGMVVRAQRGGGYQITDTCQRCGKTRVTTRTTGFLNEAVTDYKYGKPADWVTISWDDRDRLGISSGTFAAEKFNRCSELLSSNALPPLPGDEPVVPEAKFKGAS